MKICHAQHIGRILTSGNNTILTLFGLLFDNLFPWAQTNAICRDVPCRAVPRSGGSVLCQIFPCRALMIRAVPNISVPCHAWYQDLDTKILVPGSWYQDLGTKILVPGYQDLGTKILVPRSWYQDLGTEILVSISWYQDLGTKILVPSSWYQGLGTRILVPRFWYFQISRSLISEFPEIWQASLGPGRAKLGPG